MSKERKCVNALQFIWTLPFLGNGRSSLLLAREITVYKKLLVGKLPQTAAQRLMIQRCNLNTNIWTQSVAELHLEEIRLKYQCTWKCNRFTKKKKKSLQRTQKVLYSTVLPQCRIRYMQALSLTMFVYPIRKLQDQINNHCQQSIAIITWRARHQQVKLVTVPNILLSVSLPEANTTDTTSFE